MRRLSVVSDCAAARSPLLLRRCRQSVHGNETPGLTLTCSSVSACTTTFPRHSHGAPTRISVLTRCDTGRIAGAAWGYTHPATSEKAGARLDAAFIGPVVADSLEAGMWKERLGFEHVVEYHYMATGGWESGSEEKAGVREEAEADGNEVSEELGLCDTERYFSVRRYL